MHVVAEDEWDALIDAIVDEAPPLDDAGRAKLAALLPPVAAGVVGDDRQAAAA